MSRGAIALTLVAALSFGSACGGANTQANVSSNTRADAAHLAAQATEPRTGDATAGCFVRATFDYDARERAAFDTIIARVVRADPACAPP